MSWDRVLECFADRPNPEAVINRLTKEWAERYGVPFVPIGPDTKITREVWSHKTLDMIFGAMAEIQPLLITDEKPRRMDGPLVSVFFGANRMGQIDGRRRANLWRNIPGQYEVLILCGY